MSKPSPWVAWKDLLNKREHARNLRMPNLIGVGAARCGTTSLYHVFKNNPDIFTSPVKELVYFSHKTREVNPRGWSPEEYMLFFSDWTSERWGAEISPHYLHDPEVPERIKRASPEARIIIQLRDPVSRMVSHFHKHAPAHKFERLDKYVRVGLDQLQLENRPKHFAKPWNNLHQSFYAAAIERYLNIFGEDRVAIIHVDHFDHAPQAVSGMLSDFLDIPVQVETTRRMNAASDTGRETHLPDDLKAEIQALYHEDYQSALSLYAGGRFVPHRYGAEGLSV